jgi:Zn-dependent M16 (insulinase) family peptidase
MLNKKFGSRFSSLFLSLLILFPACVGPAQNVAAKCTGSPRAIAEQSNIHGFSLKKTLYFEGHPVYQFQHDKSGLWLIVEKNNNIDKKFEIVVRTPPENNKGTNHVIEHCVLEGSREYPCKGIFWELMKVAHATFMNALTHSTHTSYPVSSTDEDELESLAKIYTSGVLHPLFLQNEKIFKKEGIRYELNEKKELRANGAVFNEMQNGSSEKATLERLFPDTQGKNLVGGIPEDIMDLSYAEICDTYKKYYKPSNMLICLSGDVNYEKFMEWLDRDYLSAYENQGSNQVNYLHQECENMKKYEVLHCYKKGTDKNLARVGVSYIINPENYKKYSDKLAIIESIVNNPDSAQNKFLKEKGYLSVNMSVAGTAYYDPIVTIDLCTDNPEMSSQDYVEKTLDELATKYPITQSEINQIIGNANFAGALAKNTRLYEDSIACENFIASFIRFNDPCSTDYFNIDKKGNIENGANCKFDEKNIKDTVNETLSKSKQIITVFLPTDDNKLNPAFRIEEKLKSLDPRKNELTQNYEEQKEWSESPDSPEHIQLIKNMFKKLSGIKTPTFNCPIDVTSENGNKYYQSAQEIGDFISYRFTFKINHLSDEDKKYWYIVLGSLESCNTKNYSRKELEEQKSGKLLSDMCFKITNDDDNQKNAFLTLYMISRKSDTKKAMELLKEQINNIDFQDKQTLKELLKAKNLMYYSISNVELKLNDLINKNLYERNYLSGTRTEEDKKAFYKEFYQQIDNKKFLETFSQKAEDIKSKIFNKNSLQGIGICASKENQEIAKANARDFAESLSNQEIDRNANLTFNTPKKEAIAFIQPCQSNSNVVCIVDSKELSHDINFISTCKLLENSFLIQKIREKNGAYGAHILPIPANDAVEAYTFKDPNISSTLDTFKSIPEFIRTHEFSDEEIENISKNSLGSLFEENKLSLAMHQLDEAICQNRDYCKLLNQNIQKIKKFSREEIKHHGEILEKLIDNMRTYVITGKLDKSDKKLFNTIVE